MENVDEKVISKLNNLIELDYDAIEAYEAAIARLEDTTSRAKLAEFCGDHERHTRDLAGLVRRFGGTPAHGPDMKRVLTKGKVVLAGLVGNHTILLAMLANEEVTNKSYEAALKTNGGNMDVQVHQVLEGNLADERRHRDWISARADATA